MEHLPGYITIGLSIALTSVFLFIRWREWKRRWGGEPIRGIPVRFAPGVQRTYQKEAEIQTAITALDRAIHEVHPNRAKELMDWMVEIVPMGEVRTPTVPNGKLPSGQLVGGSIRTERAFPLTKLHQVSVVVEQRAGLFLIHEVARHIISIKLGRGGDPEHADRQLELLERAAMEDYRVRI